MVIIGCAQSAPVPVTSPASTAKTTQTSAPTTSPIAKSGTGQATKLRFTCALAVTHHATQIMKQFEQEVESGTKNLVDVELYPGGELFSHADVPAHFPLALLKWP